MSTDAGYRPCVGIMLLNAQGRVFIGRRRNKRLPEHVAPGHEWQMPQGGIDSGEQPLDAALRELAEETSVSSVQLLAEASDWLTYDLPNDVAKKSWRGRYRGTARGLSTTRARDCCSNAPMSTAAPAVRLSGAPR